MSSIEDLWDTLQAEGELGGARRVDDVHPCDLYAALDAGGRRGLILVTDSVPPTAPRFEAVDVITSQRLDNRWSVAIWLGVEALLAPFARLCQDLVEASRLIDPAGAGGFMLSRLARWRRLLEPGSGALSITELRGLAGELVVLDRCLQLWPPGQVVDAWLGPLDAPQDFALPSLWVEAKAALPSASVVRITSVDQLDVAGRLLLAVVTLANVSGDSPGVSPEHLVDSIREQLTNAAADGAVLEFDSKLATLGYADDPVYSQTMFRIDAVRFFEVKDPFPLIRRRDLPSGISEAVYDIELSACAPFETALAI